jgi:hypothetical protein
MVVMLGGAMWIVSLLHILSEDLAPLKMTVLAKQKHIG